MAEALKRIVEGGVIAIMRAKRSDQLLGAADALLAGGLQVIEVTMTTPGALDVIRQATERYGEEVSFGIGSVLDGETARAAMLAGAKFVVCPVLNESTVTICRRYGIPVIPGVFTSTEVVAAWQAGADLIKIFPANLGGPAYIKDLLGPLPQVKLVPTGGVDLDNAADFIRAGGVALGIGGSLINQQLLDSGKFAEITDRAKRFREQVAKGRAGHT